MADVFISYSKADRPQAEALADELELHGYKVWWDTNLYGGEDFHDVILQALDSAKAVIVIWSESSVKSPWVRGEAQHAQSQQKLIPTKFAKLRDTDIPLNFRTLHTEPLEDRDRILRAVERFTGRKSQSTSLGRRTGAAPVAANPAVPASRSGEVLLAPSALTAIGIVLGVLVGNLVGIVFLFRPQWLPGPGQTKYLVGPGPAPGYAFFGAIGGLVGVWFKIGGSPVSIGVSKEKGLGEAVAATAVGAAIAVVLANLVGLIMPITHLFWDVVNILGLR